MSRREVQIVLGEVTELVSALKRDGHHVQRSLVTSIHSFVTALVYKMSRVHVYVHVRNYIVVLYS